MIDLFNRILGTLLPAALSASGLYLGIYTGLWHPRRLWRGVRMLYSPPSRAAGERGNEYESKTIEARGDQGRRNSPARALALALAGTLGVGNIAGVAAAIWAGGAGAVFWMMISALLATSLKYSETLLGIKHRRRISGEWHGGAPIYIEDALGDPARPQRGRLAGHLFALLCILNAIGMGCMLQVNAAAGALLGSTGTNPRIFGAVMALAVFFIARGGGRRISSICGAIVPFISVGFFILSIAALILRASELPRVLAFILRDAFSFTDGIAGNGSISARIIGGIFGFFTSRAVRCGVSRGLISNEAGSGTSPLAHATANTSSAVQQGFLGIAEVVVDTLVLAAATALVVLTNYDAAVLYSHDPAMMTIAAYASALGKWAVLPLAAAVLLFAAATVACWAFYGQECIAQLGLGPSARRRTVAWFNVVYAASAYIGAVMTAASAWAIADMIIGVMTMINLAALLALRREVRGETATISKKDGS